MVAWRGNEMLRKIQEAERYGIDKTMADCVIAAKSNHPGWQNRTGTAEGSIRVVEFAHEDQAGLVGTWGSVDVNYMIWLELNHGSALRNAADANYPKLRGYIAEKFGAAA